MDTQFVNNIASGNNVEAEKIFKDTMSQKVGDALEIKRKEMSNSRRVMHFREDILNP